MKNSIYPISVGQIRKILFITYFRIYLSIMKATHGRVYVARRDLKGFNFKVEKVAHSAILIVEGQSCSLVEYMADGKVYCHKLPLGLVESKKFVFQDKIWDRQQIGKQLPNYLSAEKIFHTMESLMSVSKYILSSHNCHIAQEATRYSLGLATLNDLTYKEAVLELVKKAEK